MNDFLAITRALGDESRVRALLALRDGELCVCQIIDLLQLSPSTVSKHMAILQQAGLVDRRKDGRWHFYRLAARSSAAARGAIRWTLESLRDEQPIVADAKALCCIRKKDLKELSACYNAN